MLVNCSYLTYLLPFVSLAAAQYGDSDESSSDSSSSSSSTQSSSSSVQTIVVGRDGLTFDPEVLTAEPGTTVEFRFWPQRHSVGQSSFDNPCEPLSDDSFFSGFIPSSEGAADDVFTINVTDSDPIWYYCPTGSHCQSGMVGVINPPEDRTIEEFRSAAQDSGSTVVPPEVQGGTVGPSASESNEESESDSSSTATGSAASATSTGAAGQIMVAMTPLGIAAALAGLVLA